MFKWLFSPQFLIPSMFQNIDVFCSMFPTHRWSLPMSTPILNIDVCVRCPIPTRRTSLRNPSFRRRRRSAAIISGAIHQPACLERRRFLIQGLQNRQHHFICWVFQRVETPWIRFFFHFLTCCSFLSLSLANTLCLKQVTNIAFIYSIIVHNYWYTMNKIFIGRMK
jgi:hypothetical protein